MKALLFSDLHDSSRGLAAIVGFLSKNKDISGLIFAGDLVNMGEPVSFVEKFVTEISQFNLPLLWVPGNNDFGESYKVLKNFTPSLEGRIVELSESGGFSRLDKSMARDEKRNVFRFTGIGGSPASWASEYAGENSLSAEQIAGTILVSHYPPPGIKYTRNHKFQIANHKQISNLKSKNSHCEESATRQSKFVYSQNSYISSSPKKIVDFPVAHICGHVHNTQGIGYIGETKVIKLSSSALGNIAIMNLGSLEVKFMRLL